MTSYCTFLSKLACGTFSSLSEIRSWNFQKKHLSDATRHFPSKIEVDLASEITNNPALAEAPFKTQAANLFAKYNSSLREKLTQCLTAYDSEEFLELMLTGVKPEDVESFLGRSCNSLKHRFCDAASVLGISSVILTLYWKYLLKSTLLLHLGRGGIRSRVASLIIRWKVSNADKLNLKSVMKYFHEDDNKLVQKAVDHFRRKAVSGKSLYTDLLRDDKTRLLHIFDQIREFFTV